MASGPELYFFDSGTLGLGGIEVPVPYYLLRHAQGHVLVDGGNPLAVARDPRAHWGALADVFEVHMSEEQHCVAALRRLGVAADSVRYVVQTHLHIDHTGALGHFPDASVVVNGRELQAALGAESEEATGYVRADFDRPDLRWQTVEGEFDLFDDGAIRLIETPGHSAGHMSLVVTLPDTGPVMLTADAADNRAQWEGRAHPRALSSREDANRSLESLRQMARELDPLIVFGHDPENWSQLARAPHRYS